MCMCIGICVYKKYIQTNTNICYCVIKCYCGVVLIRLFIGYSFYLAQLQRSLNIISNMDKYYSCYSYAFLKCQSEVLFRRELYQGGELLCLELLSLHKKWSFPLRISSVTFPADLLTFTEQIPNRTLYFLCGLHIVFANFEWSINT